jgi:hypothetical protein
VNTPVVRGESVFDRHAGADLSVVYGILVPQPPARTVRAGAEGVVYEQQQCGDLRPGVFGPAAQGRHDRVTDRGVTRPCGRGWAAGA